MARTRARSGSSDWWRSRRPQAWTLSSSSGRWRTPQPVPRSIKETRAGAAAGVSSTPTLFINGTPYVGLPDYASLSAYIDELASS